MYATKYGDIARDGEDVPTGERPDDGEEAQRLGDIYTSADLPVLSRVRPQAEKRR